MVKEEGNYLQQELSKITREIEHTLKNPQPTTGWGFDYKSAYSDWASKQGHSLRTLGRSRWPRILASG